MLIPLAVMVLFSFWQKGPFGLDRTFSWSNWTRLVQGGIYLDLVAKSLRIALITMLITLALGFPLAYFLAQQRSWRRGLTLLLVFMPFWTSYVARTFAWLPMLGRTGLVNYVLLKSGVIGQPVTWLLYDEGAVYVGLIYVYLLFMTIPIYLALDRIDPALIEAAHDLGAPPLATLCFVIWPLALPGVLGGCLMVFLLGFGAYVTPALLGGPSGIMLGNVIADQFGAAYDWPFGASLAVTMVLVIFLLILLVRRWIPIQRVFLGTD
mgnify:CR=1 FL=1